MDLKYEHLVGREYVPGRVHCYTLVQDFFRDNFNIDLPYYALPIDWSADDLNLIEMIWPRTGFAKVDGWTMRNLRPADVLCVAVGSSNPNHFIINLGQNKLLHHLYGKRSDVDPMREFWRMSTCFVLRHPDVPDLTPALPETSILELARARYNSIIEA